MSEEILLIDDAQRRKLFGYAKAAWEAEQPSLSFNEWRHEQQQSLGISSLKFAPRESFFTMVHHYKDILEKHEEEKQHGAVQKPIGSVKGRKQLNVEGRTTTPQLKKIEALIIDLGLTWEYVDGMSRHMFKVRFVEHCKSKQLRAIITALVVKQKKTVGKRATAQPDPQGELFPQSAERRHL